MLDAHPSVWTKTNTPQIIDDLLSSQLYHAFWLRTANNTLEDTTFGRFVQSLMLSKLLREENHC